jgi:type I restriction enzyme S subunit
VSDFPLVKLSEVVRINPRNPDVVPAETDRVTFVPMAAVEAETGRFSSSETRAWRAVKKGYTRFQENDVLVAKITPCMENGKACVARHLEGLVGAGSTEFHVLRPITAKVEPKWVLRFVNQRRIRHEAKRHMSGAVGQQRVPASFYQDLQVPLPDLETQQELLERLEDHDIRIDASERALFAIQAKLKQARASILNAAVDGRLLDTQAELECISADAISSAATLMTQISEHRNHKLKDIGKSIKPGKSISSALMAQDNEHLNPPGWARATVASLCWDSDYGTSAKCTYENQGCPVLRIPNIVDGKLELVDIKRASESAELKSASILKPGDFLFIRTNGSLDLIGRGCVIQNELKEETSFASYLIRLRLLGEADLWRWFSLVWSSNIIRKSIRSACKSSAGQNNISLSTVKGFEIPIPPPHEIRRILHEVDRRFSVLDQVEATVVASLRRCGQLRQAVLKRAFGG